jgi:hypothetical protein
MMTFAELTSHCTPDEVDALAWQLANIRARATWEALRSRKHPPMMELPPEGWKPTNSGETKS